LNSYPTFTAQRFVHVGIAYADLAGVPPVYGMYSAIFPLFAYALFGSSKQLMTGPDAATCIIVAAALGPLAGGDPERYMALMLMLTLMTGLLYVIAGSAKLGFIANFLSQPILTGYLNGIALQIIVGQLPKLFGYHAMKGKTQLVGIIAGGTMLVVLLFLTAPLAYVPTTALAAVILVSAVGLFDLAELRTLFRVSHREFGLSVTTTLGVLVFGVLPGCWWRSPCRCCGCCR